MIKANDNIWREDSNFIRFDVNFHAEIVVFGAKIKIGEKVRISEQCVLSNGILCSRRNNLQYFVNNFDEIVQEESS